MKQLIFILLLTETSVTSSQADQQSEDATIDEWLRQTLVII